ncbi:MAG: DMT family transporter [Eubacteriales bacterium]
MGIKKIGNNMMLWFAALIWGVAFVAQSAGAEYVGAFTFNASRSVLGGVALLPCIYFLDRQAGRKPSVWGTEDREQRKSLLIGGILCGLALTVAVGLQQIGIGYTSVGKAGFISALYIVIVPMLGIFVGRKASPLVWGSIAVAVIGMYFLCITEGLTVNIGDIYILLCAVVFSIHILIVDYFAPKVDAVRLSCLQFFVCAIASAIIMLIKESSSVPAILSAWVPITYAGVLSSGVAYTLQIVAQKRTHPAVASLMFSLESVFAALAGWLILGQGMTPREIFGSALIFVAIVVSQLRSS